MAETPRKSIKKEQECDSETEIPTTPKKRPIFVDKQQPSARRVKSFTQMREKQSVSMIYILLVFIWVVAVAFVIFFSFQNKLRAAESGAHLEIQQCRADFVKNKCHAPVKGLIHYCSERQACMNDLARQRVQRQASISGIFGEILNEMVQGMGLLGLLVGLALIGILIRQKGKEKQTVTMQFFDDK